MSQSALRAAVRTTLSVLIDVGSFGLSALQSRAHLAAENLFLRKQLALYLARQVKPRRADDATRITLVALSPLVVMRKKDGRARIVANFFGSWRRMSTK